MEKLPSKGISQIPKRSAQASSHIPLPVRKSPHTISTSSTSPLVSSVREDPSKRSSIGTHAESHIPLPDRRPLQGGGYYSRFPGSVTLPQDSQPQNRTKMSEATSPTSSPFTSITQFSVSTESPTSRTTQSSAYTESPRSTPQQYATSWRAAKTDPITSEVSSSNSSSFSPARTSSPSSTTQSLVSSVSPSSTVTSPIRSRVVDSSTSEVSSSSSSTSPQHAVTNESVVFIRPMKHALVPVHDRVSTDTTMQVSSAAHDSELKKNLLSMISKSEDRRRKTRALPRTSRPALSLRAPPDDTLKPERASLLTSPEDSRTTEHSLYMHSPKNETSPMHLMEPRHSLSLSPVESLTPENSHVGALKHKRSLPLSPVESLTTEYSLPVSPLESASKSDDFLPLSPIQSPESFLLKSPDSFEQPPVASPLGEETESAGRFNHDLPVIVPSAEGLQSPTNGECSETMMQPTPVDSSSSTELDVRNLVSLELEMESKNLPASSDGSLGSDRSLPTGLGQQHTNLEEVVATSLPDLDNQYQAENSNQSPGDVLHRLQINTLQSEKESMQLKLQQAQAKISSLEMETVDLRTKFGKATVQLKMFEESVEREQQMTAELCQKHAEEVKQTKKDMREQFNAERERLLNQIRELTVMKEHASTEVHGLKSSLSEAHELASSSTSNLERHEAKHQVELENIKIELQALQELYDEAEKSHSNLLKSSKKTEERIDELLSEKKMLEQKLANVEDSMMDKSIKLKLQAAEKHISQLQSEKSQAVIAVEQKAADDSIKMQVKHREAVERLQRQLADAKSKLSSQSQMLQDLTAQPIETANSRPGSGRIWPAQDQSRSSPIPLSARYLGDTITFKNKRCSTVPHHGRSKKHEDLSRPSSAGRREMVATMASALEKEGHEMVSEETTLHLWKMKEQAKEELKKGKANWEKEKKRLESKLEMANQQLSYSEVNARSTQVVLKQKLEAMLQKSHLADEQNASMRRKQQEVLSENQELKGKLIDLRGRLMDKSVQLNNVEADLSGAKRDSNYTQKELSIERHQKNVLQSKVNTLENQVVHQKREMKELKGDAKEKLTSAGDHVRQTRHEVANLKAKIGELEGEVALLKQQLSHATEQRETLQNQLDSLTSQLALMETQLHREKAKSIEAQAKLEQLESETEYKGKELQRELGHCSELQMEITTTRKKLERANVNIASLESEVMSLRAEHVKCHNELSTTTKFATEIETRLQSTTADLTRFQELAKKLQDTITVTQNELETTTLNLEVERQGNRELQAMVEALSGNLERSGKQLEALDAQFNASKRDLSERRLELQRVQQENHTLTSELKQNKSVRATLESELERSQRDIEAKSLTLMENKQAMEDLAQELTDASSEIETYKIQVEEFQSQLNSSQFENSRLMKDREINAIEMQSVMLNIKMTTKQLEEKKTQLHEKGEDMDILEQEKMSLTSEMSEYKREVHSLAALKTQLENDLGLKVSELEVERNRAHKMEHDLQRKNDALKSFESEVEKLQCGLICEKEQIATLGMEQSNMQVQLQKAREQKRNLEAELEGVMEESRRKSEHDRVVISQLKEETRLSAEQFETLNSQYTLIDTDNQQNKQMLDSANAQITKLKAQLSTASCDLGSTKEAKESLQKQLLIAKQQLDSVMSSLSHKIAEQEQTSNKLTLCQSQLTDALQEAEKLKESLKAERSCNLKLQSDFERVGDSLKAVRLDLERVREEDTYDKKKVASLSSEIVLHQSKNQQLTRDLGKAQNELIQLKEASAEARASFTHNMNLLRTAHKEEKETWRIENDALKHEYSMAKEQLSSLEKQLDSYECKLQQSNARVIKLEEKCAQQKSELLAKNNLETHCHHLESAQAAAKIETSELKKRLASQAADIDSLKDELESMITECSSLKDKMQYQRETAAASLNRIQKQNQEKCTELHSKIQELNENIKEAHILLRKSQQESARIQAEKETLNMCVNEETERSQLLRAQLRDRITELNLLEEQLAMSRKSDEEGQTKKAQLQQALSEEMLRLQNCEACVQEHKEVLESTTYELQECKKFLTKECSTNNCLKQELTQFKCDLAQAKKQLDGLRSLQRNAQQRGEIEMTAMRQKYHNEKKLLKEKFRDVQAELESTITECKHRSDDASQLAAANKVLVESHKDAVKKASHTEQKFQDKKQECNCLRIKLQASEVQAAQLQAEIATLEKTQLQVEEYKKRADCKSKKDMQKVLAEVTDHMEQQYSSHRYLEKLRTDNECIALKEKERTISQLKDDLKMKKQENKQDKLRLEQVQLETSFLKTQQKDQDRSRRRLESRLEQVNDTLSRTLPQQCPNPLHATLPLQSSSAPLYTSTPATHRNRTRFAS